MSPLSPGQHPKKVAVIIPCYNEAASIGQVIAKFSRLELTQHGVDLQIFVIDNNSSDNTADIAKKAGAQVIYEPKKGKGNAMRAGFAQLPNTIDYVVMLDGDDTYNPKELLRIIEPLHSDFCDVVVGSRLGGRINASAMCWLNRFGNHIFTIAVRLLYRANVTDVLTGYFAWKKSTLDELSPHIKSQGFAIEMEMITKMAKLGHRMTSVPISYDPRAGGSHLQPFRDGLRVLSMLVRNLVWRTRSVSKTTRKIIFVSDAIYPYMKGGKEKRLHEITKRLSAMGNDVHIYTMHWWPEPTKTKIEHGVYLHAICKYHNMYHGDRRTIKEALIFGLACFKLLRVPFDVLDVDHMPFFPIFSAWIVCWLRGRRLYATWHEALSRQEWIGYMGQSGNVASFVERISIRLPHRITAASAQTKELLATIHGRAKQVELVASGIDTSLMANVTPAPVTCDILYVGRLVKDKHVDKLILAMKKIVHQLPTAQCIIIGHGIEKSRLQQTVARHKLQQNVTFLEPLADSADIYAYMKAAKVFCTPSVREGFGITSLEALGCGTPVVTVDTPGNAGRHLICNGQNGSIVPLNTTSIANALLHWITIAPKPPITIPASDHDWHQIAQKQAEVYML